MKQKYKIGPFTAEIISDADFSEADAFARFHHNSEHTDYKITVNFVQDFPEKITNPTYETTDRVYSVKNNDICCYYKSHDKNAVYYAYRKTDGNNINLNIAERFRSLLRADVIFNLTGIEELAVKSNCCLLHSSYIEYKNSAILFTGPCSIGKSTQANLWHTYTGATIVNGDKTIISIKDGKAFAQGLPFSGSSKDCLNITAPLKAIICLNKGKENRLKRLFPPQSFYSIYKNCYPVSFSENLSEKLIDIVTNITSDTPVFEYSCLPEESAVRFLLNELNSIH